MEELFQESAEIGAGFFAVTHARYDATRGALEVEQYATSTRDRDAAEILPAPPPRHVQENIPVRSVAIRYVVTLADDWIGIVRGSVASA